MPNLVYTDANTFSLWRDGKLERICAGPTIPADDFKATIAATGSIAPRRKAARRRNQKQAELLG